MIEILAVVDPYMLLEFYIEPLVNYVMTSNTWNVLKMLWVYLVTLYFTVIFVLLYTFIIVRLAVMT